VPDTVESLAVAVTAVSTGPLPPLQTFPLAPGITGNGVTCTTVVSGNFTCTISVAVPAGRDTLRIGAYDAANGSGSLLSQQIVALTVAQGAAGSFPAITLDANPGSLTVAPPGNATATAAGGFVADTLNGLPGSLTFDLSAEDADGDAFAGQPGTPSLAYANLEPSAASASLSDDGQKLTVTPSQYGNAALGLYVIPAHGQGSSLLAALTYDEPSGTNTFPVATISGAATAGATIVLGAGTPHAESLTVASFSGTTLVTTAASAKAHTAGDAVADPGSDGLALLPVPITIAITQPVREFLMAGSSWIVPTEWTSFNRIEAIGAGGRGGDIEITSGGGGGGGGGGAYAAIVDVKLSAGSVLALNVGSSTVIGLLAADTYLCATPDPCSASTAILFAQGGLGGSPLGAGLGGAGGAPDSAPGITSFAGGNGGSANGGAGGGGGAAGPHGAGAPGGAGDDGNGGGGGGSDGGSAGSNGGATTGGNGGNDSAGTGGGIAGAPNGSAGGGGAGGLEAGSGGSGGNGLEWSSLFGSGGGAGGGGLQGGNGGSYGGGAGGGRGPGTGGNGLLVITYVPAAPIAPTLFPPAPRTKAALDR
jgi:hypothetical protein